MTHTHLSWEIEAELNKRMPEADKIIRAADFISETLEHVTLVVDQLRCLLDIQGYNLKGVLGLMETLVEDVTCKLDWRELRRATTLAWGVKNKVVYEKTNEEGDKSWELVS